VLTLSAVAAGVVIVVFITSLIFGLQQRWTTLLTETMPHVTIRVAELRPTPLADVPGLPASTTSSRLEQRAPQQRHIEHWAQVVALVRGMPNVRMVAPVVRAQAFVSKGGIRWV
jgi:lipoprotein-releasing system permease protein